MVNGLRVLLITSAYPTSDHDARGTFIASLARALVAEGAQVTVLAPGAAGAPAETTQNGVRVVRANYWINRWQTLAQGLAGIVPNLRARPWLLLQVPLMVLALIRAALRLAPAADVVHAHWVYPSGIAGVVAARRAGKRLVVTSHGGDLHLSKRLRFLRWIAQWVSRRADLCIGVSRAMVSEFRELGVPEERIAFLPLGVDVSPTPRLSIDHSEAFRAFKEMEGFRIIYAGSLSPRKAVHTLIEAHHMLEMRGQRIATLIVGAGPERDRLHTLSEQLGTGQIIFAGHQPPATIAHWLKLCDVLVLPSRSEGRPLVLIEAMAHGVPFIASDIEGPRELANGGKTGFLFPYGNAELLSALIQRLANEPETRERLRSAGLAYVRDEGLTSEICARRHLLAYDRLR
jgi:glycosyltransferase involved in cell wall biosynthesis